MFHATEVIVTNESTKATEKSLSNCGLIRALVIVAAITCILLSFWALRSSQIDPYTKLTLELSGSQEKGGQLFRINCAGCHGINAQGLVGPTLQGVTDHYKDRQIIKQVVSGKTPPMPSFEMEPQAMADLLQYLHNLN